MATVIVVITHQGNWGKGKDVFEACKNAKVNCASKALIVALDDVPEGKETDCYVTEYGDLCYPHGSKRIDICKPDVKLSEIFPFIEEASTMMNKRADEYTKFNTVAGLPEDHWFNVSEKLLDDAGLL